MATSGKFNPLDPVPDPARGNVLELETDEIATLFGHPGKTGQAVTLSNDDAAAERAAGRGLYLSHFATCPNRAQHRKR